MSSARASSSSGEPDAAQAYQAQARTELCDGSADMLIYSGYVLTCPLSFCQVVESLASKHAGLLFLSIEAEEQPDIAESFDIEAVPTFLILRVRKSLGTPTASSSASSCLASSERPS